MKNERIKNGRYLDKYFTQFPNIIDDSNLDPFEFRVLLHYYRVGECWEGVRTTAEKCGMSIGKVAEIRKSLEKKEFIQIQSENGGGVTITVVNKASENIRKYDVKDEPVACSCGEQVFMEDDRVFISDQKKCSPHELKNNPIKNNHKEDIDANASVELFPTDLSKEKSNVKIMDKTLFKACVKIWLEEIHPGWSFSGAEGKSLKGLIEQMRKYSKNKNEVDPSDEALTNFFKHYCMVLPDFYKDEKLTVLNSKFDTIMKKIKNGEQDWNSKNTSQRIREHYGITSTTK